MTFVPPTAMFAGGSSTTRVNTAANVSAIATGGRGACSVPVNPQPFDAYRIRSFGNYQTPVAPSAVKVDITVNGVVVSTINVAASILATSSTLRELLGEATFIFKSVGATGTIACDGWMEFEVAAGTTRLTFSSAATVGTASGTVTVDTTPGAFMDADGGTAMHYPGETVEIRASDLIDLARLKAVELA